MLFIVTLLGLALATAAPVDPASALGNPVDVEIGAHGLQAVISLGTPGQDFNVVLDTNVGGLWIPGVNCNEDFDGASCDTKNTYDPKESFTYTETSNNITLPYLGEEIEANIAFDKFRFGPHYESGLTENNIKFGIVNKLPIAYEDLPTDGVLGLGQYSQQGFDSPFVQLLKRGNLPNPVLSIYVPRHSTPTSSAVISLGTEDLENCQKVTALHDSAIVSGRNWAFQITGTVIGVRSNYEVATLDFSSDYIHLPDYVYDEVAKSSAISQDPITKELLAPCNFNVNILINLASNHAVQITKEDLLTNIGGDYCALKIKKSQGEKPFNTEWKLGLPFLKYRCTVLDYNGKLGFALQEN